MLLIGVRELRPGLRVREAVVNPTAPGRPLLKPGAVLTEPIIASLARHGVRQLWVEHTLTRDLDDAASPELLRARLAVHAVLRDGLPRLADRPVTDEQVSVFRRAILDLVRRTDAARPFAGLAEPLYDAGALLASHSANTAYLSILIGLELESYVVSERPGLPARQAAGLVNLGLGAMLHDVGKVRLDAASRARHEAVEPLAPGESSPYATHPDLGDELLADADVPATVRHIVRCHHHRADGTGWPDQGAGPDDQARNPQHVFARIVSAANVLDSLMFDADGGARPAVAALSDLASPRFDGWFDPVVRHEMLRRLPPFAIGSHVGLSDGRWAVVIAANPHEPCRPEVRVPDDADPESGTGFTLPLSEERDVCITSCLGVPVGRWHFDVPDAGAGGAPSEAA